MNTFLILLLLSQLTLAVMNGLHLWAEIHYAQVRPMAADAIYPWEDKYLFVQSVFDLRAGQWAWAVKDLKRLIEASPYHLDAMNNLGVAYWMLHDRKEAEKWFRKALRLAPEYRWAKENLEILLGARQGEMNIMLLAK